MFVKKLPLEYQNIIKIYFCTYFWASSDACDSRDSRDSSESKDSSESSDSNDSSDSSYLTALYTNKLKYTWNLPINLPMWQ